MDMPVSGVLVVPVRGAGEALAERLGTVPGCEVQGIGPGGVAAVLEAPSTEDMEKIGEKIREWDEVAQFHLVYLHWDR